MKNIFRLALCFLFIPPLGACSNSKPKDLDNWLGDYTYNEVSVKMISNYKMNMAWSLSINKINDLYKAILNVNGEEPSFSLLLDIFGNSDTVTIIYNDLLGGADLRFNKGDTLFILSKTTKGIITKWVGLKPQLSLKSPKECSCFNFIGANANNNTLIIH